MKIKINELENLVRKALLTKYSKKESDLIARVIIFGEISGKTSHGLIRLFSGNSSCLAQKPKGIVKKIKVTKVSEIIDANGNPNMLAASVAVEELVKLAKKYGFAIVGTKGAISTSGSLSYYVEKIAVENLIGVAMARSPLCMPPYGGIEPLFGTNPIAWGIPANPKPFIFDMGTTAISYGAVRKAMLLGQELPGNVALDAEGNSTSDPKKALDGGSLLPFDNSYKGSGLAFIVEILAGTLTGAGFGGINENDGWGNVFIAFSPELLTDIKEFRDKMARFVEKVRTSKTKDGSKVRIPGENTIRLRDESLRRGWLEIDDKLIEGINKYLETGEIQ
jgi:LDH2 family malate/lactate/ureidoglycolate dehydrogenase